MSLADIIRQCKAATRRLTATKPARKPPIGPRRAAWGKSRYRGVYVTPYGRWHVQIRVGGRLYDGGTYRDEAVAAGAYNVLAAELLRDKARLNVIEGR